jgi:hypothetical protein
VPRKDLIILTSVFLSTCALYFLWSTTITFPGFPLDDSWIHQVFARNLATGHGFSFNPDHPIAGATAPLWTVTLVIPSHLLGPLTGAILTGMLFQWLALIGVYKLSYILMKNHNCAFLVAVLSALCWPLVWGALSGMEVGLYSALSLWGLYFYFKSENIGDSKTYLAYLLFVLASLSRPECGLFVAAALIRDLVAWLKAEAKSFAPWLIRGLIIAVPILPYLIFNYSTTNSLLPLTVSAKIQGKGLVSSLIAGETKRFVKALVFFPYFYLTEFIRKTFLINAIIVLAFVAGMLKLTFKGRIEKSKTVMLVFLFILYTPMMGALTPMTSPSFHQFRLCANLLPLLTLFGVAGLFWREGRVPGSRRNLVLILSVFLTGLGASAGFLYDIGYRLVASAVVQVPARMNAEDYMFLGKIVKAAGIGTMITGLALFTAFLLSFERFRGHLSSGPVRWTLMLMVIAFSAVTMIHQRNTYAYNVLNINERNVAAGRYLRKLAKPGDTVAVNDIGAIGYFSRMNVLDLKGLISPQITKEMIIDDSLAFEYMYNHERVDYMAIAPAWFEYLPRRTDIFHPLTEFISENNTIVAGDTTIVYEADWPDSSR